MEGGRDVSFRDEYFDGGSSKRRYLYMSENPLERFPHSTAQKTPVQRTLHPSSRGLKILANHCQEGL